MAEIDERYYAAFQRAVKRNPKMEVTPTMEQLEAAGCNVSGMGYLVGPDLMQWNAATVNPGILPDTIAALFVDDQENPAPGSSDTESREDGGEAASGWKVCKECGETKLLIDFAVDKRSKKDGHSRTCNACKEKSAPGGHKDAGRVDPQDTAKAPQRPAVRPPGIEVRGQQRLISVAMAKEFVNKAYLLGYERGQASRQADEVTFEELLEVGT